jgi:hypothetical protein
MDLKAAVRELSCLCVFGVPAVFKAQLVPETARAQAISAFRHVSATRDYNAIRAVSRHYDQLNTHDQREVAAIARMLSRSRTKELQPASTLLNIATGRGLWVFSCPPMVGRRQLRWM